jgi:hypothetical protein
MPRQVTLVRFVRHPIPWYREFQSWTGSVGRDLNRTIEETAFRSRQEAPHPGSAPRNRTGINYSTGELSASIITRRDRNLRTGDPEGSVITLAPHGLMIQKGTKRHTIKPRNPEGRLTFFWAKVGRVVSFKKVTHPGTDTNPFMERALIKAFRRYIT